MSISHDTRSISRPKSLESDLDNNEFKNLIMDDVVKEAATIKQLQKNVKGAPLNLMNQNGLLAQK